VLGNAWRLRWKRRSQKNYGGGLGDVEAEHEGDPDGESLPLNEPVADTQPEDERVPLADTVSEPEGLPELLGEPLGETVSRSR
jgi:hypothetical protein